MSEAIRKRRSIRKFKPTPLSEAQVKSLLEAARLSPSGCNVQPWRFIVVRDKKLKRRLCEAAFNQKFIEEAPIVFVCCGDLSAWKRTREHTRALLDRGDIVLSKDCEKALTERIDKAASAQIHERVPSTQLNVAIAIEHIVLQAVELRLGSCWVRLFNEAKVKKLLSLPDHFIVVALLPVGVPREKPKPRPRLPLSSIRIPSKGKYV